MNNGRFAGKNREGFKFTLDTYCCLISPYAFVYYTYGIK